MSTLYRAARQMDSQVIKKCCSGIIIVFWTLSSLWWSTQHSKKMLWKIWIRFTSYWNKNLSNLRTRKTALSPNSVSWARRAPKNCVWNSSSFYLKKMRFHLLSWPIKRPSVNSLSLLRCLASRFTQVAKKEWEASNNKNLLSRRTKSGRRLLKRQARL